MSGEGIHTFTLSVEGACRRCEIQWVHEGERIEARNRGEQRLVFQLGASVVAVNVWLACLGADSGYAFGTIYEYGKVLLYTLSWLGQQPVRLETAEAVDCSLFALS